MICTNKKTFLCFVSMDLIKIWKKFVSNCVFLVWLKIGCLVSHVYHGCSNISRSQHNQKKTKNQLHCV